MGSVLFGLFMREKTLNLYFAILRVVESNVLLQNTGLTELMH